ncbi:hypothetical protein CFHF_06910 [Caulobacter flavus]|uniref:Secretin/TonB short N-terminal domain-containing protein n=1 Tax=Caulobacter flavus TaxID=1679497 RepID=A0A2N5CW68_9CAUL|nr:TonB-dependent receptor [Caulobacter flavus]AYV44942.1 hypothetical protein C1707_00975 [Caulobacter flavus]PLR18053.1 hypothetical protein CFHF_06910 [Caulobacter flavus]
MRGRLGLASVLAAAIAAPAVAAPAIDVDRQDLSSALRQLARQSGAEFLFASGLTAGKRSGRARGRMSVEAALDRLLEGTGLVARRTADGVYVLASAPSATAAPASDAVTTVPEILVLGRRALNGDLRRLENGVQPYAVHTTEEIALSQAGEAGSFLRDRVLADAAAVSPAQARPGAARSELDLLGLGPNQTLVLVDGRRLPRLPGLDGSFFRQPDINALPLGAIERIETIPASAGGIYGLGALGGVVNIVLRRDHEGGEATAIAGLSSRGDAGQGRLEARLGFSPDGGRTEVSAGFSTSTREPLRVIQRDFTTRYRAKSDARTAYEVLSAASDGRNVMSYTGQPLVTDAGVSLGSNLTTLPLRYAPGDFQRLALQGAGALSRGLGPDASSGDASLLNGARSTAITASIRRALFGVETYLDFLHLETEGEGLTSPVSRSYFVGADAPTNPFQQDILVSVPFDSYDQKNQERTLVQRLTAGAIIEAPRGWRVNLDASTGVGKVRVKQHRRSTQPDLNYSFVWGEEGLNRPVIDPFADYDALQSVLGLYRVDSIKRIRQSNRFSNLSARAAGPAIQLPAGPANLTLAADWRDERIGDVVEATVLGDQAISDHTLVGARQTVASLYAEANAPIFRHENAPPGLAGLELQASIRLDDSKAWAPALAMIEDPPLVRSRHEVWTWTAGARAFPVEAVMLRASAATGALAPTASELITSRLTIPGILYADPGRPGDTVGSGRYFVYMYGSSPALKPERAESVTVGMVVQPPGSSLRASLDYTRLLKRDGFYGLTGELSMSYLLANPQLGRVSRAPPTAADIARGYTVGRVLEIDGRAMNSAKLETELVSGELRHGFAAAGGRLDLRGSVVWQPSFRRKLRPGEGWTALTGDYQAPLEWRGYGGATWRRGAWTLAASAQFDGTFRTPSGYGEVRTVPAQVYVDLAGAWRTGASEIRLGVRNLFDRSPSIFKNGVGDYNTYADPRRRRFELALSRRF